MALSTWRRRTTLMLFALECMGATGWSKAQSDERLIAQFQEQHVFWQQFEIAEAMLARKDRQILPALERYLSDDDRHERANAAYVFAGLGDPRGFDVLTTILNDLSDRPDAPSLVTWGGIRPIPRPGEPPPPAPRHTQAQIEQDRYYAAAVLGELGDSRAVPALVSVLDVPSVNMGAIGSLEKIGDHRAVAPLIAVLATRDPSVRVLAIRALEKLRAKEAIPALRGLLTDPERSNVDDLVPVADAAKHALSRLE